ncbi:MAG: divergent polysaccharide deacetylase family protein [Hydrogenophaga sp.]|nr:divergent polysaccharide deacetylase family protein [Hydrogenophaga sp.]
MSADLHAPLGQGRRPGRSPRRRPSLAAMLSSLALVSVIGLSTYSAIAPLPLRQFSEAAPKPDGTDGQAAQAPGSTAPAGSGQNLATSRPLGGATVQRTVTDDGSVVTKFTPKPRDGNGPVLIDSQTIGQDSRVAALPNDDLLEDTPEGRLPVIGPDGLRPFEQYARPWSGSRATRVAIVVGGIGLSQTGSQRAIRDLPEEITLAFAATGNSLSRWMQEARRKGHEIVLQVPFEPFDYPANNPGRGTLLTTDQPGEALKKLHEAMGRITNYTGVMNYMGAKYMSDATAFEPVMRDIGARGLLFLDDGSTARSLTDSFAKAIGMPYAQGNLLLDGQPEKAAVLAKLDELERIARRNGQAIGIASAFDETIAAIRQWSDEAAGRGIEIVGVSALAADAEQ